jgi:hypothetical protein
VDPRYTFPAIQPKCVKIILLIKAIALIFALLNYKIAAPVELIMPFAVLARFAKIFLQRLVSVLIHVPLLKNQIVAVVQQLK